MALPKLFEAFKDGMNGLDVEGLGIDVSNIELPLEALEQIEGIGQKVFYNCPACKKEVWAFQAFVGFVCWDCRKLAAISDTHNAQQKERDPDFFNRWERFVTMSENNKPLHPKATYKYSNFRVLYKQVDIDEVSHQQILKLLQKEVPGLVDTYKSSEFDSVAEKCVQLWTAASPLYRRLTKMLVYDRYDELQKFMPIIRGITKCIVRPTDRYRETYRGSKILMQQFETMKVGSTYRIAQILATSESKETAGSFAEGDQVMVTFKIPKGCWNAAPIAKYSEFENEAEVLFPPYTAIKVTKKSKQGKTIECEVLDNMEADRNAESRVL
jgi:hypothetical protein